MSYGDAATLQVFHLSWWRYSYSTWSSMTELLLSVLQLRNLSIGLGEELCIGFTQENSMENSLQELSLLKYIVTLVHAMTMLLLP